MKTKSLLSITILLMLSLCANAGIVDVSISPIAPTWLDTITILVNGMEGSPAQITSTDFLVNDNSLVLDIYIDLGEIAVVTPWSHDEIIGTLPVGTYNLTVNRFRPSYYPPPIEDSYSINFEVVPEPTSMIIFALGALFARNV